MTVLMIGCGNPSGTSPVHGMVVFEDGSPVRFGTIEFETIDVQPPVTATASIDSTGHFTMGTFAVDDGALPGRHRAAVIVDFEISNREERPGMIPAELVDRKYREFKSSGLQFEVKPGRNYLQVIVKHAQSTP